MRKYRTWTLTVLAMAAAVALTACSGGGSASGGEQTGSFTGDVAKGKEIFANTCASCHGADAKGISGLGKNLADPSDWMKQQSDEQLLAFLKTGRPSTDPENTTGVDMPPKGGNPALTDDDLKNVIVYIRSLQNQ